ncbi:MAG TPA: M67 family metallopeptidase, partial [Anaerolineae bacterium]|nr:M67 family metallopeptidase [Anaerolineae bacterium]
SGGIIGVMTPAVLTFPRPLYDRMLAHVLSNPTLEMCGLLAGRDGVVDRVWPVPNALHSPVAYRMDGSEFSEAMIGCDFEPLGIFHSHPAGPPVPSPTDIAEAAYPDSIYVVISLQTAAFSVRGFTIVDGQVGEVRIDILK